MILSGNSRIHFSFGLRIGLDFGVLLGLGLKLGLNSVTDCIGKKNKRSNK